jgi:hypothetical protein
LVAQQYRLIQAGTGSPVVQNSCAATGEQQKYSAQIAADFIVFDSIFAVRSKGFSPVPMVRTLTCRKRHRFEDSITFVVQIESVVAFRPR